MHVDSGYKLDKMMKCNLNCNDSQSFGRTNYEQWRLQSVLMLQIILFVLILLPAQSNDLSGEGYLFNILDADWGPEHIYVWPNGIKKVLVNQKFTLLAAKPTWQPIAYRDQGKMICKLANRENALIHLPPTIKITRVKSVLKGLPVVKETIYFKPTIWDETDNLVGEFMPSGNAKKARVIVVGSEIIRFDDRNFSPALIQASGRVLQVNLGDGIAVENRWILSDGKRLQGWSLVNWKHMRMKHSDFVAPENYKACRSFKELEGSTISTEMEDLAKQMDFGEPLGQSTPR